MERGHQYQITAHSVKQTQTAALRDFACGLPSAAAWGGLMPQGEVSSCSRGAL